MILRPYQLDAVAACYTCLRDTDGDPCIVLPTGCHAPGHPILMFDGTAKAVEDVQAGDLLMGPDSRPRRVLNLCVGRDAMYRITPKKGDPFVVNGDHVLSLKCTNEGKDHDCYRRGGEVESATVREWLDRKHWWRHLRKLYRTPADFPERERPDLCPWALGALLGDGYLAGGVSFRKADPDILDALWAEMERHGLYCNAKERGGAWHVKFADAEASRTNPNRVTKILRDLGLAGCLSGDKFVPDCYKLGSREDRLDMLAGLLDTDGCLARSGYDFISKSERLSRDVVFIARSLGLAAYCSPCEKRCQTGAGGTYFRVNISGDCSILPMRCARKKAAPRQQKKDPLVTGFDVEPVGEGEFFGFALDGDHLYLDGSFTVHHNSGKTPVIAQICSDAVNLWSGRVVVLAHVKELLEQSAEKIKLMAPDLPVGMYSAGLGQKDLGYAVTVAGIQSIYQHACDLGPVDLVIVDEAHLIPPDGEGMYRQFLRELKAANPHARVIGLTATPYRMKSGEICGPGRMLTEVCYEVGVRELITQGYLCPLRSKAGIARVDTTTLHTRAGEFIAREAEALMDEASVVQAACKEIVTIGDYREACLIFCAGIDHGRHVVETIEGLEHECGFVEGNTPADERAELLGRFRGGDLKYLANVNVLTTGFDAPNIDLIALLRPTLSPGLYYQMLGRGFRLCEGKTDCIVLDYGGNVMRHGPVDAIKVRRPGMPGSGDAPVKECPACMALVAAGYAVCPECEFVFPKPESRTHSDRADEGGVLSGDKTRTVYPVTETCYYIHIKRGDESAPLTMRVEYKTGFSFWERQWLCFDHDGYARTKAEKWWKMRSDLPVPRSVEEAVRLARLEALAEPSEITVEKTAGKKWTEIVDYKLGPKPEVEMPDDYEPTEERDPYMAIPDDCPF